MLVLPTLSTSRIGTSRIGNQQGFHACPLHHLQCVVAAETLLSIAINNSLLCCPLLCCAVLWSVQESAAAAGVCVWRQPQGAAGGSGGARPRGAAAMGTGAQLAAGVLLG